MKYGATVGKANSRRQRQLGYLLSIAFVIVMAMGVGPGVMLVNRPTFIVGIPLLYAWGVLWYFALVAIAIAADFFLWRHEVDEDEKGAV